MQEQRFEPPDVFKEDPTLKEFADALANPENKAVTVHPKMPADLPEGSIVERWQSGRRVKFRVEGGELVAVET